MNSRPVLGLVLSVALAPMAWAGAQAAHTNAAATGQSASSAHGHANLPRGGSNAAVRSGTRISGQLLTSLNAKKAKPGQQVEAKVTQNVKQDGRIVIRKNSRLIGHVVSASASGKGHADSQVQVVFDRLVQGNTSTALNTVVTSIVSVPMAPMPAPMEPMGEPMSGAPAPAAGPMGGGGGGGGGLLGGVGGAVNSTVNGAAGVAGSAAGDAGAMAGSTIGETNRMGAGAMGSAANAVTVTNSLGAIGASSASVAHANGAASAHASHGIVNAGFNGSGNASNQTAATSTFRRHNGNVQLGSGTNMQFQTAGDASAQAPSAHSSSAPAPRSR